jgi:Glycosyl transferase family group 2
MRIRHAVTCAGWAGVAAVTIRGITGTRHTLASLAWLSRSQPAPGPAAATDSHIIIIMPLLREQQLIAATLTCMTQLAAGWPHASVAVVTTEREYADREAAAGRLHDLSLALSCGRPLSSFRDVLPGHLLQELSGYAGHPPARCLEHVRAAFSQLEPTPAIAGRLAARGGWPVPVRAYHLPDPAGTMADQVNYAAAAELALCRESAVDPARTWLAIYNADSVPSPATLPALAGLLAGQPDAQIVQQPAIFTRALGTGLFADGAALLQSRWTLAREIPRLRRQAAHARAGPRAACRGEPLAHCTGHGLFIRADTFTRLGGLPATTMNEDLAFGYLACAAGVAIDPLPALELADSPAAAAEVIRQARQWFWSYPQYPMVHGLAARAGLGTRRTRITLTAQGLARGALWLGQSPAIACALALPAATRRNRTAAVAAVTGALAAYYGIPFTVLTRYLRRTGAGTRCGPRELAGGLAACLTSSTGPWWCLGQAARARLTRTRYIHGKTER